MSLLFSKLKMAAILGTAGSIMIAAAVACGAKEEAATQSTMPTDLARSDAGTEPAPPGSFGTSDASASASDANCQSLNIGILGIPGENDSSNFQVWLAGAGTSTTRVLEGTSDRITSAVLAPFDVVVVDRLRHDLDAAEAQAFETWLSSGKGAMTMTGYLNAPEVDHRANPLLARLGLEYVSPWFNGPVTSFVAHPTTEGLNEITFLGGYAIDDIGGASAKRTVIASTNNGDVGYAVELAEGRAFVWGDEWIEFDSEWTELPEVQRFWVNIFGWLAPNRCRLAPKPR